MGFFPDGALSRGACLILLGCGMAFAQTDVPHFALGVAASSLGVSVQAATGVSSHSNLRGGFNFFNYDNDLNRDGVTYKGHLELRSVQVTYDYFFGPFHISPGALIYNGNRGDATAVVPGGRSFTLGGTTF